MSKQKYQIGNVYHKEVTFQVKNTKIDTETNEFVFEGYASTFGNEDLGGDIVVQGAFAESIVSSKGKTKMLWQHNRNEPIGIFVNLKEDSFGLFVEGRLPLDDAFVKDRIVPQLKIGSIDSMSIGYILDKFEVDEENEVWRLLKLTLKEISLVTFPMNEMATITNMKKAAFSYKWDREAAKELKNPNLFIAGLPIGNEINSEPTIIPKAVFSARISMAKGNYSDSEKKELNEIYTSLNMEPPFEDGSKMSLEELKNLSKSDRAWAIKNLQLSTKASNHLAELLGGVPEDKSKGSEDDNDDIVLKRLEQIQNIFTKKEA